jgi:hypothetical protein
MDLKQVEAEKEKLKSAIAAALAGFSQATDLAVTQISIHVQGDPDDGWRDYEVDAKVDL